MKDNGTNWKKLLWSLPEPLLVCEKNGQLTFANKAAALIFNEVEGRHITALIPQLTDESELANWINQKNQREFETLVNGTLRRISWSCKLVDDDKQQDHVMLFPAIKPDGDSRDKSAQENIFELFKKQFGISVEDPEMLFRKLFTDSPIGIALIDSVTKRFADCNAALIQMLGYNKLEIQQHSYFDITPKRYHQLDRVQTDSLYIAGRFGPYEKAFYHKNGNPVQVIMHGLSFFKSDGNRMVMIFVQDISEHSAVKAALQEHKNWVKVLFEETPKAYFIADLKGVLLEANQMSEQLIGESKNKLIGKSLLQMRQLPLSEVPKVASMLAKNSIGKQSLAQQIILNQDDGKKQIIELSSYPVTIGERRLILGTARDITERHAYEQELISERNKARRYLDIAGSVIIGFNRDLTVRLINQAGCLIVGKEKEEIIGKDWSVLLRPGTERDDIQIFLKKAFSTNSIPQEAVEVKLFTRDGLAHYFLWKNTLLFDEDGVVNGILSSGLDVTELKQTQNLLSDKELKTSRLNQLSQLALQIEDKKSDWIALSEKLQEMMQCDVCYITTWDENKKQAIPLAAPEALYDYYINYRTKPHQKSLTQSVLEQGEALIVQNAETTAHISSEISHDFKTKSGLGLPMIVGEEKLGAILVGFNSYHNFSTTEVEWAVLAANHVALALHKSKLINELKKSNEDKDRFFSILSHDLKSPLSGLEHLVLLLKENQQKLSKAELAEMLQTIHETTRNLNILIDNMLSWSRLNRGLLKLRKEQFDLNELINEVCNLLENRANEKKISLCKNIDSSISLEADREMLKAVLRNLVNNAIKFSYPESEIRIKSKLNANTIALIVEDDGVGIKDEHLEQLHKSGNMPSTPGTAQETGTGLGLLIIQEFVKLHQGRLLVQSKLQKGSTFTVELPSHTKTYS